LICCTLLAIVLGLLGWPASRLLPGRSSPLAWRPYGSASTVLEFSLAARLRSFGFAFAGLVDFVRREHNAWIHLAAAALVIAAGLALRVSLADWRWLVLCIALVLAAEAFNTAVEALCDLVQPERHPVIKRVKDLAAGAVLLCAIGAALIGSATLVPYLAGTPMQLCGETVR
jgi:diacylglycerol kinase (ATP)